MLLRNYDNIMLARTRPAIMSMYLSTDTTTFGDGFINTKDITGTIRDIYKEYYDYGNPFQYFSLQNNDTAGPNTCSNLVCGSGNTNCLNEKGVHYDDYCLASPFTTTQITGVGDTDICADPIYNEDGTWTFSYSRNFLAKEDLKLNEETGVDTRVKEIGVYYGCSYGKSTSYYKTTLVYRKVLDTPLSVEKDQQFTLTFTTTISGNPNKPADYEATATVVE